ncbi:MAG: DNA-directed RNA polymerase subunit alpha [Bacteroidales bacterium]|nr:DNA-directed RNA polymerase subunit alpha [Bacteroidales bacterium]NLK81067.1 DNA-directed RNA polymerase subunit alpha [Bacteroidales bacterium]
MAILAFQKPDKVIMIESDDNLGTFEFRPLEPGYGITVGNAIRRVLLSSLEGYAVTNVKIEGVEHEYSTIKGVVEDVTEIVLNIKQIRFKQVNPEPVQYEKVTLTVAGKNTFTAGELNAHLTNFQVINTDLILCNLNPSVKITITFWIGKGRGYVMSDDNKILDAEFGVIPVDSIYTPVKNVKYSVEDYRVEQKTDFEKLILEIKTDGSIHPKDALKEAAKILIQHFMLFSDEKITLDTNDEYGNEEFDEEVLHMRQLLKTKLVDMDLSVRALNCLKAADVEILGELVQFNKNDLLKFRNFGKKSLSELEEVLAGLNLSFSMDITKYKLEKE